MSKRAKLASLTFDIEEWDLPEDFGVKADHNCDFSEKGLTEILKVLDTHNIRATFFITVKFAEEKKRICRKASEKHEIACHGLVHDTAKDNKLSVYKTAKKNLEDIIGKDVIGYRAPRCMIEDEDFLLLQKAGFQYDSSIRPTFVPNRYNYFLRKNYPHRKGNLLEFPISVVPLIHFPIDWWWLRNIGILPTKIGAYLSLFIHHYFISCMHSWDVIPLKRIEGVPYHIFHNTGKPALEQLNELIRYLSDRSRIVTLQEQLRVASQYV